MGMKSDLVDLVVVKHSETDLAWLVSDDGDLDHAIWMYKSQAKLEQAPLNLLQGEPDRHGLVLTCLRQLAINKGLV